MAKALDKLFGKEPSYDSIREVLDIQELKEYIGSFLSGPTWTNSDHLAKQAIPCWSPTMLCKCEQCRISWLLRGWRCATNVKLGGFNNLMIGH